MTTFKDLTPERQEALIELAKTSDDWVGDEWWFEDSIGDFTCALRILGISDPTIYFSGFGNQGDGACFIGNYSYAKQAEKELLEKFPTDTEFATAARKLAAIQRKFFYSIYGEIKHLGHYYHESSVSGDFEFQRPNGYRENLWENNRDTEEDLMDIFKDVSHHIYKELEKEYFAQFEDEYVRERLNDEIDFEHYYEKLKEQESEEDDGLDAN